MNLEALRELIRMQEIDSRAPRSSSRTSRRSTTARSASRPARYSKPSWPRQPRKAGRPCQAPSSSSSCTKGECNLGQHEIAFKYDDALTTADQHTIYKTGAKEIAAAQAPAGRARAVAAHRVPGPGR
jgi:hypothetical protein